MTSARAIEILRRRTLWNDHIPAKLRASYRLEIAGVITKLERAGEAKDRRIAELENARRPRKVTYAN